jgi:hypothetical protein
MVEIRWIDFPTAGRLAIMPRPRAGDWLDDEIRGWRAQDVDVVVSLLEGEEIKELDLGGESALCRQHGIEFISFPIPDRGVPASLKAATDLIRTVVNRIGDGQAVAVHCRAGIGRSSVIAASALIYLGADPGRAFELIGQARGVSVPDTDAQRDWVRAFCRSDSR